MCQAGCGEAVEAGDIKLTSLKQDGCGLNWELETENEKVVFIVSGLDHTEIVSSIASGLEKIVADSEVSGVTRI